MEKQYLQRTKLVRFEVLKIEDIRKTNSTIEIGKTFLGSLYSDNCVYFTDINDQEWCFYVDDTCRIVDNLKTV